MDKIRDLMIKAGCKEELVGQICESLDQYRTTLNDRFEADFKAKVDQAKKVCVEETDNHKRELSRRLQIFLEAKSASIEAALQRQAAIGESEATANLRKVKALLEGINIEVNGTGANGTTTAELEKAQRQIKQLAEERNNAITLANKKGAIAEKVILRNRTLTSENVALKARGKQPVAESHNNGTTQTRRIDTTRRNGTPMTTRPTIVENQDRRPQHKNPSKVTTQGSQNGFGVNDIAEIMDSDLI